MTTVIEVNFCLANCFFRFGNRKSHWDLNLASMSVTCSTIYDIFMTAIDKVWVGELSWWKCIFALLNANANICLNSLIQLLQQSCIVLSTDRFAFFKSTIPCESWKSNAITFLADRKGFLLLWSTSVYFHPLPGLLFCAWYIVMNPCFANSTKSSQTLSWVCLLYTSRCV